MLLSLEANFLKLAHSGKVEAELIKQADNANKYHVSKVTFVDDTGFQ